jgi:serine hydrolase
MKRAIRAVIIHGTFGAPQENWFPWLLGELKAQGLEAYLPCFPTPEGQTLDAWRGIFAERVGKLDESTILIGHSLGAGFILNLLEEAQSPVLGCFLVSGFIGLLGLPEFDALNASFVEREFDWQRIKRNAGHVRVYNGDNDPYVPLSRGADIATHLGVNLQVIKGGGHINASAGYTTFPKLSDDILELVRMASIAR